VQGPSQEEREWVGKQVLAIEILGLKRIEKDAVLAKMGVKVGALLAPDTVKVDLQTLFGMGYFQDVSFEVDPLTLNEKVGVKLLVSLKERPVISKIEFEGNERLTESDLREVIKVKEWSILDINRVKEDLQLLAKHYEEKGYYLAKARFEVQVEKADEVKLIYRINDYDKVQIKKVTFLNNKVFSDSQLSKVLMDTREGSFLSFLTSSGNFKENAFKQDLQRLTYWYLDNGYVKFRYDNPVVTMSEDKRSLFITIYVEEGEKYTMGEVDYSGDLLFPREELAEATSLKSGESFSITKRNADIQRLTEKYQDLGYAFVNVVPKMNIRDDSKLVDIDYSFEKGNLTYFGEITVIGNTKTHDKVIRREIRFREGELFSGSKLRISRENVERLGFFQPGEVLFNTITPPGRTDVLNVEVQIKERSTGTITLGAGYGSISKFFFQTQISEINLFGRGQVLSLAGQYAANRFDKSINLGFTDPFVMDTFWSAGFDFYFINFRIPAKYVTRRLGMNVRFGHPIFELNELTNAFITYKNEGMKIENADPAIDPLDVQADEGVLSSVVWSVIRDRRNNRFETTAGQFQSVSLETAGLGGDKKFVKWTLNNRFYTRLVGDLIFRNSTEYGQIRQVGDRRIPPSERFYLGGPNNMRGFQIFALGPTRERISVAGVPFREPIGGSVSMFSLWELEYPIVREAGLKFVTFYDVGNAFETFPTGQNFTLRSNLGLGFRWFSPIGPLRFEWGFPFKPRPWEDSSVFQFFIGPPF
jgi:outer membrane protein insertion porin family